MSTRTPPHDEPDRDAWLREALRHAPDAGVAPPPALSMAILQEARAKARSARPAAPGVRSWRHRLWTWMAQPMAGAALASLMLGTLVTLMWRDAPEQAFSPRVAEAPLPEKPDEAPAPAPATTAPSPATTGAHDLAAAARSEAPPARKSEQSRDAITRRTEQHAADAARALELRAQHDKLAEGVAKKAESAVPTTAPDAPPDAWARAARTAEAMSPATPVVEAAGPAPGTAAQMAAPMPPAQPQAAAPAAAPALAPSPPARQRASPSGAGAGADAFLNLRVALSSEAARWSWQRGHAAASPVDDALAAFLAEVHAAVGTRWEAGRRLPAAGETADIKLLHDGRLAHVLTLEPGALRWTQMDALGHASRELSAPLDAAQHERLQRALAGLRQ